MRPNVIALSFLISISFFLGSLQTASAKLTDSSVPRVAMENAQSALTMAREIQEQRKDSEEIYYFSNYVPKELKKSRQAILKQRDPATKKSMQEAFNKNAEGYSSEIKAQYDKLAKVSVDSKATKKERKKAKKSMDKLKEALQTISYEKQLVERDQRNFARGEQFAALRKAKKEAQTILTTPSAESTTNNPTSEGSSSSATNSADQGTSSSSSSSAK